MSEKAQARLPGGPGLIFPFFHGIRWASAMEQKQRVCRTSQQSALDEGEDDAEVDDTVFISPWVYGCPWQLQHPPTPIPLRSPRAALTFPTAAVLSRAPGCSSELHPEELV